MNSVRFIIIGACIGSGFRGMAEVFGKTAGAVFGWVMCVVAAAAMVEGWVQLRRMKRALKDSEANIIRLFGRDRNIQ